LLLNVVKTGRLPAQIGV